MADDPGAHALEPERQTLDEWVQRAYDLSEPTTVKLIRSYTNDVFEVRNGRGRWALKLYGLGWRNEEAVRYELGLIRHLQARGLSVVQPALYSWHDPVRTFQTAGGPRVAVLFEWLGGTVPAPPFSPGMYRKFGRTVATIHHCSDDFWSHHQRSPMDETALVDAPLEMLASLTQDRTYRDRLLSTAEFLRQSIGRLKREGIDWGPIHGDASFDNLRIGLDNQLIVFDFDSGGPGWRASDLQGWAHWAPERAPDWQAFIAGYREVRLLPEVEVRAAPYLTLAWELWGAWLDLERRILPRGAEAVGPFLAETVQRMETNLKRLPPL